MLTKVDERTKYALRRLATPEMADALKFLQQEAGATMASLLVMQDERMLRQLQGKAQFIDELLRLAQHSE